MAVLRATKSTALAKPLTEISFCTNSFAIFLALRTHNPETFLESTTATLLPFSNNEKSLS
jgi:hypothetical protein